MGSDDVQAGNAVADLAQADAQARCRGRAVEPHGVQCAHQDVALLLIQPGLQVVGQIGIGGQRGGWCRYGGGRVRWWRCARRAGNAIKVQLVAIAEGHGAVQQVLQLAHVARQRVAGDGAERRRRQGGRG